MNTLIYLLLALLVVSCQSFSIEAVPKTSQLTRSKRWTELPSNSKTMKPTRSSPSILFASKLPEMSIEAPTRKSEWTKNLRLAANLSIWYAVSALYNIYNKRALNAIQMPWTMALLQLGAGLLIFIPLWVLNIRKSPLHSFSSSIELFWALKHIVLFASIAHFSGVFALGLGTVSFTQVVKAAEPLFTAVVGGLFAQEILPIRSYLSLIPVMIGVCLASVSELTFSWPCFAAGIISNSFSGARNVFSKKLMKKNIALLENLSAENMYSILTVFCFLLVLPVTLLVEWSEWVQFYSRWQVGGLTLPERRGVMDAVISGLLFYLYNEMSFKVLSEVSPITHALANTMKRIVIIITSVLAFGNKMTIAGQIGSALAIMGTFLYSLSR